MPTEKERLEQELIIQRQVAFASGLFQGDITVRTLLESLGEAIIIIDRFGTILLLNARAEQMFDYPKEEIIGKAHSLLIPERLRAVHEKHVAHYFEEPRVRPMGLGLDLAGRRRDGSEFPVEISLSFLETINGRLVLAFISDISRRKEAELHLRERDERLRVLNNNLSARALELEAANKELEAFNYTVTHDLRKHLAVINGYCQAILEIYGDTLEEEGKKYLGEIYNGTMRMNQLIDALLKFSATAHGELRREPIDLSGMAKAVAEEQRLVEPARRVTLKIAEGITVNADRNLLQVAMENLLGNAWKYTCKQEEAVIEFGVTEVAAESTYFVRDNGPGFDMADAEKLFIPFQRLPDTDAYKGHGIGLATVERIIKRHGGKVWAEGEPGKGATFYFTLQD